MRPTEFIHMADIHLGYAQYNLEERLRDFEAAFREAVDKVLEVKPDFVLVCGDLFHHPRPSNTTLEFAIEQLCRLRAARIPVLAVDGSHDSAPNSITGTILRPLDSAGLLTYLPRRPGSCAEVGDCYIYGMGYLRSRARKAELNEYLREFPPAPDPSKANIMAFHMALSIEELGIPRQLAGVSPSDLPSGFDYYAGGHIHRPFLARLSELGLPGEGYLAYSGSTETVSYKEADYDKGLYLVRISGDKEIEVERIRLEGTRKFVVFEEDITGLSPSEATEYLIGRIKALDERGAVLIPIVVGELPPGAMRSEIDLSALRSAAKLALAVRPVMKVVEAGLDEIIPAVLEEREDLRARALRYFQEAFRARELKGLDPDELARVALEILDPLLSGDKEKVRELLEGLI